MVTIVKYTIDGVEYDMYRISYKGKEHNVASFALHEKINELIECDRYLEVKDIDGLYNVYIPEDVDPNDMDDVYKSAIDGIDDEW